MDPAMPNLSGPNSRLLVVDGHAYAYRAFFAIRNLKSPSGEPTNAIFGFIKMLGRMRAFLNPTHAVVVWDGGLAAERLALLPGYKAQRPPMPPDLEKQLDGIVEFLRASAIPSLMQDGVEADDSIATLARRAGADDCPAVIASSDKDFMQLVSGRIGLLNPGDRIEKIWGVADVLAKTGVEPGQVVDWLSLIGDAVDNIPGVRGVGPKTATDLIRQLGSISGIYQRLNEVKSDRLREALAAARADLARNQDLIRLRDDLPGDFCLKNLVPGPPDNAVLRDLYSRWGFRTLREEIDRAQPAQGALF
jgi:DNA polymerase-1